MKIFRKPRGKTGNARRFIYEWKDADGDRHRVYFTTAEEAASYKAAMMAQVRLTRLSRQLGQRIRLTAGDHDEEIRRLLRDCSRITSLVAVGKKAPGSITLGEQGRLAL